MTELFIKNKFIQFLKSDKNFPDDSFLLNYHYVDKGGIIYVDLAILDTKTNNYIALIDFRNNISNHDIENYNLYKKVYVHPMSLILRPFRAHPSTRHFTQGAALS